MKILFLTPGCFDKGGISRYSRYQITALREMYGPENIRVLSLLGPTRDGFEIPFNTHWYAGGNSPSQKARFSWSTIKETLSWRPDVIHIAHVNLSGLGAGAARLVASHAILNTYGHEVWSGLKKDALWGLKKADTVLADCHFTASYLEDNGFRPDASVEVIWDCVDLNRFTPGPCPARVRLRYGLPADPDVFIIMTLGRLVPEASHKGYARLLEVFARISGDLPDAVLVFAGRGPLREQLAIQAKTLGTHERVIFTGSVEERDLPDMYRAASVFSLVSDRGIGRGEGIPLTPLEAMACGIPILVGNHDGSQEAVKEGQNGFVLDPFDLEQHAQALLTMARNATLRKKMGTAALQIANTHFSYIGFRKKHHSLYSSLPTRIMTSQ